jgi:hypothetical protein
MAYLDRNDADVQHVDCSVSAAKQEYPAEPEKVSLTPLASFVSDLPRPYGIKGTWFDEAIDLRDPEGHALTVRALTMIAAIERRTRKRRPVDEANQYTAIRKILANGIRCHYHRQPALVSYSRRAEAYKDSVMWLSGKAMSRNVDLLSSAGMLECDLGERGTSSSYEISSALLSIIEECGVNASSLTLKLAPESLVRPPTEVQSNPAGKSTPDHHLGRWRDALEGFNSFVTSQDITLELSEDEQNKWVSRYNQKRKVNLPLLCQPELFQTDLYRKFTNGTFDYGGRMYGGWWINTPKVLRGKIRINGEPTVELDFAGCAIRMLYHERGLDCPGDPYWLAPIAQFEKEKGLKAGHFRNNIKLMTQALINASHGSKLEMIPLPEPMSFIKNFGRIEVRRMIEQKHALIADAYFSNAAGRLQRKDSDIALSVITDLKRIGVVALPIHDSFITPVKDGHILKDKMNQVYKSEFGFYPVIK